MRWRSRSRCGPAGTVSRNFSAPRSADVRSSERRTDRVVGVAVAEHGGDGRRVVEDLVGQGAALIVVGAEDDLVDDIARELVLRAATVSLAVTRATHSVTRLLRTLAMTLARSALVPFSSTYLHR